MQRSLSVLLAASAVASLTLLGCGGGGGGGGKKPSNPTLPRGAVRTSTGVALSGARVTFYGAANDTPVGTSTVGSNGLITGPVPSSATRFSVDASGLTVSVTDPLTGARGDVPVYDTFQYDDAFYSSSIVGCYPKLPRSGSASLDTDIVFYPQGAGIIPPPPDGCLVG